MRWTPHSFRRARMKSATSSAMAHSYRSDYELSPATRPPPNLCPESADPNRRSASRAARRAAERARQTGEGGRDLLAELVAVLERAAHAAVAVLGQPHVDDARVVAPPPPAPPARAPRPGGQP